MTCEQEIIENKFHRDTDVKHMIEAANYVRDLAFRFSLFDIAESSMTDQDKEILIKACFLQVQEKQQELIKQGVY